MDWLFSFWQCSGLFVFNFMEFWLSLKNHWLIFLLTSAVQIHWLIFSMWPLIYFFKPHTGYFDQPFHKDGPIMYFPLYYILALSIHYVVIILYSYYVLYTFFVRPTVQYSAVFITASLLDGLLDRPRKCFVIVFWIYLSLDFSFYLSDHKMHFWKLPTERF